VKPGNRLLLLMLVSVFVISGTIITSIYSYYRTYNHAEYLSPKNRWVAVVTKRHKRFPEPVEVRLQVKHNGDRRRVMIDAYLDSPDLWSDVKADSYKVEWKSDDEFLVGIRRFSKGGYDWRGEYLNHLWVINSIDK